MNLILLQSGGLSSIANFLPMILVLLVFYFFFIRPQQKKQKEQNDFSTNLKKGDEVVTGAGMIGKINKIEPGVVTLQVDQKTFIRVVRGAISKDMTEGLKSESSGTADEA